MNEWVNHSGTFQLYRVIYRKASSTITPSYRNDFKVSSLKKLLKWHHMRIIFTRKTLYSVRIFSPHNFNQFFTTNFAMNPKYRHFPRHIKLSYTCSRNWERRMLFRSVCLTVCSSAWNNSASTGRILIKFEIQKFLENLSRKFKFN